LLAAAPDSVVQPQSVVLQSSADQTNRRKPLLAAVMSAVVPGSGELYAQRYTKSAIFFAIDAAALTAYIIYNAKGNNKTNSFQNYANTHWSAVRYAEWIQQYGVNDYGPQLPAPFDLGKIANHDFSQINAWERGDDGQHSEGFTHELPQFGQQQYYELIGKYDQFKYGWDTYPQDASGIPVSDNGDYLGMVPQQMLNYADDRGEANRFYYAATTFLTIVVANHVLSAIDAAWSTANFNKELTTEVRMKLQGDGLAQQDIMTELSVKIHL
jgi:hypothetical protein